MIGAQPTLKDIILSELPEPVDLQCNEDIDYDEVDNNEDVTQGHAGLYQVLCQCYTCYRDLRLLVKCTAEDVDILNSLLTGTLEIVCPLCARGMN
ncbi:early protein E7 [Saimiri sciureus papillomavirus 1]|uniref:Protein E7 n=1 Tax=Saimiri sciureus papillomavirus 1 TaxID=990304 RepID=W5QK79_9PAPI|nr:early protein E7 [Saimiri sciureus papillomavirus 1]AEA35056.1 early protein E7 [Saimiri sciureus papillomavirus 1]